LHRFLPAAAVATAALLAGGATALAAPSIPAGAVILDTHDTGHTGAAGPVKGTDALTSGSWYVVKVQGTFSAWTNWPSRRCGVVEPAPMWRSEDVADAPAGDDAEFRFAQPNEKKSACKAADLPRRTGIFQINAGSGWGHPDPIGGVPAKPTSNHTYSYAVQGTGSKPKFRLKDWHTGDNNGRLAITVRAAKASDCTAGYASFGFGDAASCVAGLSGPASST
jgi:hypothetical protein